MSLVSGLKQVNDTYSQVQNVYNLICDILSYTTCMIISDG